MGFMMTGKNPTRIRGIVVVEMNTRDPDHNNGESESLVRIR